MTTLLPLPALPTDLENLAISMFQESDPLEMLSSKYHKALTEHLSQEDRLTGFIKKYNHIPVNSGYLPYNPNFEIFKQHFQQFFDQSIYVDFQICDIIENRLIGASNIPVLRSHNAEVDPVIVYSVTPLKFNIFQSAEFTAINEFGLVDDRSKLNLIEQVNLDTGHYWPVNLGQFIIEELRDSPTYKILIVFPKNYPFYHLNNYY